MVVVVRRWPGLFESWSCVRYRDEWKVNQYGIVRYHNPVEAGRHMGMVVVTPPQAMTA